MTGGAARTSAARAGLALVALHAFSGLGGCALPTPEPQPAPSAQRVAAVKETLRVGVERSIERLSREGALRDDPPRRLRLPAELAPMFAALDASGMRDQAGLLELAMNRAAERSVAAAVAPLSDAITQLEVSRPDEILDGPEDAATRLLRGQATPMLRRRFAPIVDEAMRQVGLAQAYAQLVARYRALDPTADPPPTLTDPVVTGTLHALFTTLAQEERRIRREPAARTTPALKSAFGPGAEP